MHRVSPPVPLGRVDKSKALVACREALGQEPDNPRYLMQYGYVLVLDGRASEGRDFILRAADKNYAAAEFLMGLWIEDGTFMSSGLPEPRSYFRRAAETGNPYAMYKLSLFAAHGPGGNRDEAVRWARKAAANGLPKGDYHVAFVVLLFRPYGKETEWALAVMEREIEAGNLDAMYNEAVRTWSDGPFISVPKFGYVNERAYRLMKSAAKQGYGPARFFLDMPR